MIGWRCHLISLFFLTSTVSCGSTDHGQEITPAVCGNQGAERLESNDSTQAAVIVAGEVAPGGRLPFSWNIPDGTELSTMDEIVVECYSEDDDWEKAWASFKLFGSSESLRVAPITPDLSFSDDEWHDTDGQILVPADARPGEYRVVFEAQICDPECVNVTVESRFIVQAPKT